jgi:hypothetical protein
MALLLVLIGFPVVFQTGRNMGFRTGSEWALVQADIIAREAGVFMPVYLEEGKFRVVLKQPRGLYKKAWSLADRHEEQGSLKTAKVQERDKAGSRGQAEL